jgi:hypothetical protein
MLIHVVNVKTFFFVSDGKILYSDPWQVFSDE